MKTDEASSLDRINSLTSFREYFYSLVSQIPEGMVSSYGALAEGLGDKRASRAVGKMLNQNPRPVEVPCHRVVRSDGSLGGYGGGKEKKKRLLEEEGVKIKKDNIQEFDQIFFDDFDSDKPLNALREVQEDVKEKIRVENAHQDFSLIAGVDVSYSDRKAFPALSLWDHESGEEIDVFISKVEVGFPYIPTFLAFRELPALVDVIGSLKRKPDAIMVDGNGVMHPKGVGLASHLGVELDVPTIGVAKSRLCGHLQDELDRDEGKKCTEVKRNGKLIGHALLTGKRAKNPIYVSAGHLISHAEAVNLVKSYCRYKIPDPIRRAHIEATKRRKKDE